MKGKKRDEIQFVTKFVKIKVKIIEDPTYNPSHEH